MSTYDKYRNESGDVDHTDKDILEALYWDDGLSQVQISKVVGLSPGGVEYWIKKHNIKQRDRIEAVRASKYQREATLTTNSEGYLMWTTADSHCLVSRLVAVSEFGFESVVGNEVHHKNGVVWDNRPENLEVKSSREHRQEHGKLNKSDVKRIKQRVSDGENKKGIAQDFGVHHTTINDIEAGRSWSNVEI